MILVLYWQWRFAKTWTTHEDEDVTERKATCTSLPSWLGFAADNLVLKRLKEPSRGDLWMQNRNWCRCVLLSWHLQEVSKRFYFFIQVKRSSIFLPCVYASKHGCIFRYRSVNCVIVSVCHSVVWVCASLGFWCVHVYGGALRFLTIVNPQFGCTNLISPLLVITSRPPG